MADTPDRGTETMGEGATIQHAADADVIVVGAGPGGSATATHLARRGLDVLLLEKNEFPRDKVCGDGLTPRAVKQLISLGIDTSTEAGWKHTKGLRVHGGGIAPFDMPWPDLQDFPPYGLVRPRRELDALLARHAADNGVRLREGVTVQEPILDGQGRIAGVISKDGVKFRAPVVVAADGNSSRLAVAMGITKRDDRPMGVAVRTYYESPKSDDEWLESWLELWDGEPHKSDLLPGYGWSFPTGVGTCNVGLGMLSTSPAFGKTDYKELLQRWLSHTPEQWCFREAHRVAEIRSAALPMAFNRQPHYYRGLLLVGDAGGMVNPFNGEGIDYALEAADFAAEAISEARARGFGTPAAERALQGYRSHLQAEFGGYFRLGTIFAKLIGHPDVMAVCTKYGLPRKTLMRFVNKLLANLTDKHNGDAMDRIINTLTQLAPSA